MLHQLQHASPQNAVHHDTAAKELCLFEEGLPEAVIVSLSNFKENKNIKTKCFFGPGAQPAPQKSPFTSPLSERVTSYSGSWM